jgi:hypothetical protein
MWVKITSEGVGREREDLQFIQAKSISRDVGEGAHYKPIIIAL